MKKFILMSLVLSGAMFASAADSLLYWMVDTSGHSEQTFSMAALSAFDGGTFIATVGGEAVMAQESGYKTAPSWTTFPASMVGSNYSFIFELMNDQGDVLFQSNPYSYTDLAGFMKNSVSTAPLSPLTVTAFNVPEPTSGLLVLLGVGLLGLKRKKA